MLINLFLFAKKPKRGVFPLPAGTSVGCTYGTSLEEVHFEAVKTAKIRRELQRIFIDQELREWAIMSGNTNGWKFDARISLLDLDHLCYLKPSQPQKSLKRKPKSRSAKRAPTGG